MFDSRTKPARQLFRGMVADTSPTLIRYCTAPFMAKKRILVGSAVAVDDELSSPNKPYLEPFINDGTQKISGFAVYNPQMVYELDDFGNVYYPKDSRVSVLEKGEIVLYTETPVFYNDSVLTRVTVSETDSAEGKFIGNVANEGNPIEGFFPVTYCKFVEMRTSPGLAIVSVNIIGT